MSRRPDVYAYRHGPVVLLTGDGAATAATVTALHPAWPLRVARGWVIPVEQAEDVAAYCWTRHWLVVGTW